MTSPGTSGRLKRATESLSCYGTPKQHRVVEAPTAIDDGRPAARRPTNRFDAVFDTVVRGTRFCPVDEVAVGKTLKWRREPSNVADSNAIAVDCDDRHIGYLPREVSAEISPLIDTECVALSIVVKCIEKNRGNLSINIDVGIESVSDHVTPRDIENVVQRVKAVAQGSVCGRILQENLIRVLEHVQQYEGHLLTPEEHRRYEILKGMDRIQMELLLRLHLRKATWFRVRDLDYFEKNLVDGTIGDLLTSKALISTDQFAFENRRQVMAALLTTAEMKQFLRYLRSQSIDCRLTGNKHTLMDQVCCHLEREGAWVEAKVGTCVSVSYEFGRCLKALEQLYFLDSSQDMSAFLLQELDIVKWPRYRIRLNRSVFPSRPAFDAYTTAKENAADLERAIDRGDVKDIETLLASVWEVLAAKAHKIHWTGSDISTGLPNLPVSGALAAPLFLARFSAVWIAVEMAATGVSWMERRKDYRKATERLRELLGGNACPSRRGMWWNRLVIDLRHLKRYNDVLETCVSALADDWVRHGDRVAIKCQILRLSKPPRRWKLPTWAPLIRREPRRVYHRAIPLNNAPGQKSKYAGNAGSVISVEQLALEHYAEETNGAWKGMHTEGSLWHTLFGILFWDIIFSDVEDVFRTPFQTCPLDFWTDAFYLSRKDQIHELLEALKEGEREKIFRLHWEMHDSEMCRGVNWDRYPLDQCLEIMDCIGNTRLASMCQLLAEDYKSVSGGLPDLFLWNLNRRECRLVEVKGHNDRLSDQQRAWIIVLTELEFDVELFELIQ